MKINILIDNNHSFLINYLKQIKNLIESFCRMTETDMIKFAEMAVENGIGTNIEFALHTAQIENFNSEEEE